MPSSSLAFFLGPGFPRTLAVGPSLPLPFATAADLLTPFFLGPSVGGPMTEGGAGVPLGLGVFGVESNGASGLEGGAAASVDDVVGDSLSLADVSSAKDETLEGSTMARSLSGGTTSVTRPGLAGSNFGSGAAAALSDLRRSLADDAFFVAAGAMVVAGSVENEAVGVSTLGF